MSSLRWFIVVPPNGAARVASLHTYENFKEISGESNVKIFDTRNALKTFNNILKNPNDDLILDLLNQSIAVSCFDFKSTHLLSGALSPISLFTLNLLKKQGITTMHWFFEDYRRATYWESVLKGYDQFFTIQKGPLPEICKSNGVTWHFLPTATSVPVPQNISQCIRDIDIAFIGIPSAYRIKVLEYIASMGKTLAIAGCGWKTYNGLLKQFIYSDDWINEQQTAQILQRTKIGINLSVEDPSGKEDVHISPRVFDILMSGAFCLTEETPLLYESVGSCTIDTFTNLNSLTMKINELLDNSNYSQNTDVNRIINSIYVQTHHQYINRVREIISLVTN